MTGTTCQLYCRQCLLRPPDRVLLECHHMPCSEFHLMLGPIAKFYLVLLLTLAASANSPQQTRILRFHAIVPTPR